MKCLLMLVLALNVQKVIMYMYTVTATGDTAFKTMHHAPM